MTRPFLVGGTDDRADHMNTHHTLCDVRECPGFREQLAVCANPRHDDATTGASPLFHTQRSGPAPCHGRRRRGRPRRLCGRACETWVDNYYLLADGGFYRPAETTWHVWNREFKTYREALREVGRLIATGVLEPRSPVVAFYLTPTKSVRQVRLDDAYAGDQDEESLS